MILAYAIYVKLDVIETTFKFRPSSKSAVMKSRRRRMIDRFRIMGRVQSLAFILSFDVSL